MIPPFKLEFPALELAGKTPKKTGAQKEVVLEHYTSPKGLLFRVVCKAGR
jgi:hypothetical protein